MRSANVDFSGLAQCNIARIANQISGLSNIEMPVYVMWVPSSMNHVADLVLVVHLLYSSQFLESTDYTRSTSLIRCRNVFETACEFLSLSP